MGKVQENICFYKDGSLVCKLPLAQTRSCIDNLNVSTPNWVGVWVSEKWRNLVFDALWGNSKYILYKWIIISAYLCRTQKSGVKCEMSKMHTQNDDDDEILN